jgi:hypothetical protein
MIEVEGSENEVPRKQPPTDDAIAPGTEPLGAWRWVTDGLIDETIRVWEPRYGRRIGREEAVLIVTGVVEFLRVLAKHSQQVNACDPVREAGARRPGDPDLKRRRLSSGACTDESSANSKF